MRLANHDRLLSHAAGDTWTARDDALYCVEAALQAVDPYHTLMRAVHREGKTFEVQDYTYNLEDYHQVYLIGAGKASLGMARAALDLFPIQQGVIITTEQADLKGISVYKGTHPLPSKQNIEATTHLLSLVTRAGPDDLLIALISGGGSSLLAQPRVSLQTLRA
jgi:hydroxypyruvate reductase